MSSNRRVADPFDETGYRGRRGGGLLKGAAGFLLVLATASAASFFFGDTIREGGEAVRAWAEGVDAEEPVFKEYGSDELSKLPPDRYEMAGFKVYFDPGSDELSDFGKRRIAASYEASAKACEGGLHIRAVGHDDKRSDEQTAMYLGWDRAEEVARYLQDEIGMWGIISYGSVGGRFPDDPSNGPLAWAQNRRVVGHTFCDTRRPRSEILGEKSPRKLQVDEEEKARRRAPPFVDTYSFAVYFSHRSAELQMVERFTVETSMLKAWEACEGDLSIELEGHDDRWADRFSSIELSQERASRVADLMVEELWAFENGEIRWNGYGRERPKLQGEDSETAALHRRVDAKLYCRPARDDAETAQPSAYGFSLAFPKEGRYLTQLDFARIESRAKRARAACAGTLYADASLNPGSGGAESELLQERREISLWKALASVGGFDDETIAVTPFAAGGADAAGAARIAFRCEP